MPLGKRRKFIDVNWVDENIVSQIPAECLEKVKSLQESVNLPSLPAGSLEPSDVFQIFNLRYQEQLEFEFTDEDLVEIPIELESTFEKKYHTVIGSSSAPNKALSRSFINMVIFSCVPEERMHINKSKKKAQPQTSPSFAPHLPG
ncbi:hypothetical protein MMC31_006250 [Peltigera leucophlebia]|nr:hypothetical protein [Peltigera leucophlebia]